MFVCLFVGLFFLTGCRTTCTYKFAASAMQGTPALCPPQDLLKSKTMSLLFARLPECIVLHPLKDPPLLKVQIFEKGLRTRSTTLIPESLYTESVSLKKHGCKPPDTHTNCLMPQFLHQVSSRFTLLGRWEDMDTSAYSQALGELSAGY